MMKESLLFHTLNEADVFKATKYCTTEYCLIPALPRDSFQCWRSSQESKKRDGDSIQKCIGQFYSRHSRYRTYYDLLITVISDLQMTSKLWHSPMKSSTLFTADSQALAVKGFFQSRTLH